MGTAHLYPVCSNFTGANCNLAACWLEVLLGLIIWGLNSFSHDCVGVFFSQHGRLGFNRKDTELDSLLKNQLKLLQAIY